jgi:hypothetical protein
MICGVGVSALPQAARITANTPANITEIANLFINPLLNRVLQPAFRMKEAIQRIAFVPPYMKRPYFTIVV